MWRRRRFVIRIDCAVGGRFQSDACPCAKSGSHANTDTNPDSDSHTNSDACAGTDPVDPADRYRHTRLYSGYSDLAER